FRNLSVDDILPQDAVQELLNNNRLQRSDVRRHKRKADVILYAITVSHDIVLGGTHTRLVAAYDVTERTKVEGHRRLLESVITNANDAVLVTDARVSDDARPIIVYVNEAFTRRTGYTMEEVIGKTPRILQGPNTDPHKLQRIREAVARKETVEVEIINYKKNGEEY